MKDRAAFPTNSTLPLDAGIQQPRLDSAVLSTSFGHNEAKTGLFSSSSESSIVGNAGTNSLAQSAASQLLGRFGNVDGRRNVQWTLNSGNGNPVTFSLTGNGQGEVIRDGDNLSNLRVIFTGTDANSDATIAVASNNIQTIIQEIIVNGSLSSLNANTTDITGNLNVTGSISRLNLDDVTGGTWNVSGGIANLSLGSTSADWTASIAGGINQLMVARNFSGTLAAPEINSVKISGNVNSAYILAGTNLGTDGRLGGTGTAADTYSAGRINSINIDGTVNTSVIAAGLDPRDGIYNNNNDWIACGAASRISQIDVRGTASADSLFAAEEFLGAVKINREQVNPFTDSRFLTGDKITINAALLNDTAPFGQTNSDRLTSDPSITGTLTNACRAIQFRFGLDNTPVESYKNILSFLNPDGTFTLSRAQIESFIGSTLTNSEHTFHFQAIGATDRNNQRSWLTSNFNVSFVLDTLAPFAPQNLDLLPESDSGLLNTDDITNITNLIIAGTASAGDYVQLVSSGQVLGTGTTNPNNSWQVTTSALTEGNHSIIGYTIDAAGNVSQPSSPLNITIDTTAPQYLRDVKLKPSSDTGVSNSDNITNNPTPILTGISEPNSLITVKSNLQVVGSTRTLADGTWEITLSTPLANGNQVLEVIPTDVAENVGISFIVQIVIDTTTPDAPTGLMLTTDSGTGISNSDRYTNNNKPRLTGTAEPGSRLQVKNGQVILGETTVNPDGTWSIAISSPLADGNYSLTAVALDLAGNVSPASEPLNIVIDTTPPPAPTNLGLTADTDTGFSNSDRYTNNNKPRLTGTAEPGSRVQVKNGDVVLDETVVNTDGTWSIAISTPLADGNYSLTAVALDLAGNVSPALSPLNIVIDTATPPAPNNLGLTADTDTGFSNSDRYTNNNKPRLTGTAEPGSRLQVKNGDVILDETTVNSDGTWSIAISTPLADGNYSLTAVALDLAGNVSLPSEPLNIVIDTTPPLAPTNLKLTANTDTGISNSDGLTNNPQPEFTVNGEPGTEVELLLDSQVIGSGTVNLDGSCQIAINSPLADGDYDIKSQARDLAGNVSAATDTFALVIKTTTPPIPAELRLATDSDTGISNSDGVTNNNKPTITGAGEPGTTILLYNEDRLLGESTVNPDRSWLVSINNPLEDGAKGLIAIARDNAGNVSLPSATLNLVIDTTPDNAPENLGLNSDSDTGFSNSDRITNNFQPKITGIASPGAYIKLFSDKEQVGVTTADSNGYWEIITSPLADGTKELAGVAIDKAGNVSGFSASLALTIDTTLPELTLTTPQENASLTLGDRLTGTVDGTGTPVVEISYQFDELAQVPISVSPTGTLDLEIDFTGVKNGQRTIIINTTDKAGNVTTTEVNVTVNINTPAPVVTVPIDAPVINSTPGQEALVGHTYTYDVIGADPEGGELIYSLIAGPAGMNLDSNTGRLVWNPTASDKGTQSITLVVRDNQGLTAEQSYNLAVVENVPNRPPIFTSTPTVSGNINTPYTYTATVQDPDYDMLSYSLVNGPSGMQVDSRTGVVNWTPNGNQLGTYDVTLRVADSKGGTAQQAFKILSLMEPGNYAPIITSDPEAKAYVSRSYTYLVQAVDPDGNPLTYSLVAPQGGMTINANTGLISWNTPVVGQHDVTVKVQDSRGGVDTQTYDLNVSNVAPGQITGKVYVDDRQPPTQTVYFENFENTTSPLIEWSNVGRDRTPTGRRYLGQYGGPRDGVTRQGTRLTLNNLANHDTITVSFDLYIINSWDGYGRSSYQPDEWKLSVEGNSTPLLFTAFGNYWNQVYPGQITSSTPTIYPVQTGANEVNTLGYSTSAVYRLSYTFAHSASLLQLNFSGEGSTSFSDSESWGLDNVKIDMGRSPTPLPGTTVYIDQNVNGRREEEELYTRTDAQGNYSFTLDPGTYTVAEEALLGWTHTFPTGNTYNVTLASGQLVKDRNFGNVIGPASNVAPTFISTPSTDVMVGQEFIYRTVVTDLNGDALTYDLLTKPDGMVVDSTTGIVAWRPTAEQIGEYDVFLAVRDENDEQTLQAFKVKVSPFNTTPLFTSGYLSNNTAVVGQVYQYQFQATDADSDPITYSLTPNSSNASINRNTGLFTWTPQAGQIGSNTFTITIDDGKGDQNNLPFGINVISAAAAPPNAPPVITSQPRNRIALGQSYLYAIQASDPNNNSLTFSLDAAPTGMTIDSTGRLFFQPQPNQLGSNPVNISVSDGQGGVVTQNFIMEVVSTTNFTNVAPSITSTPVEAAIINQQYQYNLTATDLDNDPVVWGLDKAPTGMSIDPIQGTLGWTPNESQIGDQEIIVRAQDSLGGFYTQTFTLTVRPVNVPSTITSVPVTQAAVGLLYTYTVNASDTENDSLAYSITSAPTGMTINADTGIIEWTPTSSQLGKQDITVTVNDGSGGITTQSYSILVAATAPNLPPAITSKPVIAAAVGQSYQYQVTASDSEGAALTYSLQGAPAGMTISPATGLVEWAPDASQVGNYAIKVIATDPSGAAAVQGFNLSAIVNSTPTINSQPVNSVTVGLPYKYDLKATDANGDPLSFSLLAAPNGMTVDTIGRVRWTPNTNDIGNHLISIGVKDNRGAAMQQRYTLMVAADTEAPQVSIWGSNDEASIGDSVTFVATATDNVKVENLQLVVNGNPVTLDAQGRATVQLDRVGNVEATATAIDAAGNTRQATTTIRVIDSSDVDAPVVNLDLSAIASGVVTDPSDIRGTVNDSNLDYYVLEVAPISGGEFREVFRGTQSVTDGVLGTFDPSTLENDTYTLRLTAYDTNGRGSVIEDTLSVAGDLKLGNFRLSFTDLSMPVSGIPINLTRTYDTLTANRRDDFGYGWRMEFRDTDLRTSLIPDPTYQQLGIRSVGFQSGTRVYLTLPGGKREGFTFKPQLIQQPWNVVTGGRFYYPYFQPDAGITSQLTVPGARYKASLDTDTTSGNANNLLVLDANGNFVNVGGQLYHPADPWFGSQYILTTKEGIVYEIDGKTGDLLTVTDTNSNKLTYTDTAIASSTGQQITFGRDTQGRITTVTDPIGQQVRYQYDALGDLVAVTDRENYKTQFIYDSIRPHFLKEIIDSLGRTGAKNEYDSNGRLKKTINATDNSVEIDYDPANSLQTVKDALSNPTTYEYDERGNVVRVIDALGNQSRMEYDNNNNLKKVTDASDLVTKYEYDAQGNLKSRTEQYCGCSNSTPGTTYYAYDKYGNMTSLVLPTGASMTMEYDRYGNMLSMRDGKGSVIQSYTYYANGLVKTETDGTGTTTYEYDRFGNTIKSIDSDGKATIMEYDANGRLKKMVEDLGTPLDTTDDEISTFTYDKEGRQTRADYGNGIWVEYGYTGSGADWTTLDAPTIGHMERKLTPDGKLAGWITPDGGTPTFYYDAAGRLWRETDAAGNVTTEYGYDAAGRLTTVKDVRTGASATKKYDAGGRVIEEIDPLKTFTKYTYAPENGKLVSMRRGKYLVNVAGEIVIDETGQLVVDSTVQPQTWMYEYNGNSTTVIDPLGRKTTSVVDEYSLPTETIYTTGQRTKASYLYTNNLQSAKDYPTEIIDIGGNDRDFTYDSFGRLKTATDLGNSIYTYTYGENGLELITGSTGETLKYGYDGLGNLAKVTYGDGTFKQMAYRQSDNRLGTITLPSGETITYDYDHAGRVKSQTSSTSGTVTFTYNTEGAVETMTDSTGTTTYRYDPVTDRLSGIDYSNSSSISYTYDMLGRTKTVTEKGSPTAAAYVTTYDYDAFGNLKSVLDPAGGLTTMTYDVVNRLKERSLPNGVKTVYAYDDLDRVKSIVHKNAQGEVLASVTYEREGIGEPTEITREDGSYVKLEYDEALRVKKESYYNPAGTLIDQTFYTYDAAGKRQIQSSTTEGNRNYTYDPGYQLATIQESNETETYDYDQNGRLTLISRDGETLDLEHDTRHHLTEVENVTTAERIDYTYDGQGRRIKAVEGSKARSFLVAPAMGSGLESTDLITDGAGNLINNYIYAGGSSPFMRLDANGNPIYYLTDAMDTVIGLADGTGQSTASFIYDAFGNILSYVGSIDSEDAGGDFRFQGQWLESGSGLYHFRARDYDPQTGLFLSRDPVDPLQYKPESFNPYQFVYNNPYVYSDATGMLSLNELQISQVINDILQTLQTQIKTSAIDGAKGVVGQILNNFIDLVLPRDLEFVNDVINKIKPLPQGKQNAGDVLEDLVVDTVCTIIEYAFPSFSNIIWTEPEILPDGTPVYDGKNCGVKKDPTSKKQSNQPSATKPDFVLSNYKPASEVRNNSSQKSWLIGDFKLSVSKAKEYVDKQQGQWSSMEGYARRYQYAPLASFITFYDNPAQIESMKKTAITRDKVFLFVIPITGIQK